MPEANVLNNLDPLASPPLDAVYEVTEHAWAQYRAMLPVQNEEDPLARFMSRRMMYISEVTASRYGSTRVGPVFKIHATDLDYAG